jgi:hypothetical protein
MSEISTRPEVEWTPDELECVRLVRETLGEVDMDPVNAQNLTRRSWSTLGL